MSLEELLAAIRRESATRAAAIEKAATQEATSIAEAATSQAEQARESARQSALQPLPVRLISLHQQSQLAVATIRQEATNQLVDDVLAETARRLSRLRERTDYEALLSHLLHEAIAALDAPGPLHIESDPQDAATVRKITPTDRPVTFGTSLRTGGGLRVATDDRRFLVDNTVETRFTIALPKLRRQLAPLLVDDEAGDDVRL